MVPVPEERVKFLFAAIVVSPFKETAPVPVLKVVAPVWDIFPDVLKAPPSATTKTSSTSNPPLAFTFPVNVEIPVTPRVPPSTVALVPDTVKVLSSVVAP